MALKDKWNKTKTLKTDTFEYDGEKIDIRELSGLEAIELDSILDTQERHRFIFNTCVNSIKLTDEEFNNALNYNYNDINYINRKVMSLSRSSEKN